jgi:predicted DNA-binding transcriptional regulator AlpA
MNRLLKRARPPASRPDGMVHVSEPLTAAIAPHCDASNPAVLPQTGPPKRTASTVAPSVQRLLWGWPEIVSATGIPRRTLEREISGRRFPPPIKRIGRRPFWRPADVIAWAEGGGRP